MYFLEKGCLTEPGVYCFRFQLNCLGSMSPGSVRLHINLEVTDAPGHVRLPLPVPAPPNFPGLSNSGSYKHFKPGSSSPPSPTQYELLTRGLWWVWSSPYITRHSDIRQSIVCVSFCGGFFFFFDFSLSLDSKRADSSQKVWDEPILMSCHHKGPVNCEIVIGLHKANSHKGVDAVSSGDIYNLEKCVSSVEGHRRDSRDFRCQR